MELFNLDNGRVLSLEPGTVINVGRGPDTGIASLTVSRNHCTITYEAGDRGATRDVGAAQRAVAPAHEAQIRLTVNHSSGAAVIHGPLARRIDLEPLVLLPAGASCKVRAPASPSLAKLTLLRLQTLPAKTPPQSCA